MSITLCRVDRRTEITLSDDSAVIRLERKGVTLSEWAVGELQCIQVAISKGTWSTGHVRFVRLDQPLEPAGKYSPFSDPDGVPVSDNSDQRAAAAVLRRMGAELGVPISITDASGKGETPNPDDVVHSVRTKKGVELVRLSDSTIAIDNGRVEMAIADIDEIRVKNPTFGQSFLQIVRKGDIQAWPDRLPDAEYPNAIDLYPVVATESLNSFLRIIESLYPDKLVRLHKRDEREAALRRLHARSEETTGSTVYWSSTSRAFGINVYRREIWLGDPFRASSVGGPIAGAHASYSVSGNIITSTRTVRSMAGNTHVQSPQDERIFQLTVTGPGVSLTASASADQVSDAEVAELVNTINAAARSEDAQPEAPQSQPLPPKPQGRPDAPPAAVEASEGLRRLMKLYAAGLIDEDEFAAARADLD